MTTAMETLENVDSAQLERLHRALEDSAARDGLLDAAYRTLDTPIGNLLIAATDRGVVRVAFASEGHDAVLDALAARLGSRILRMTSTRGVGGELDAAARELDEYFAGHRTAFDLPLDLSLSTGFRRTVLGHLREIAYGSTESYAQVAEAAGSPRAVRAVGSACATNPLPVIVPCHRVLRSDGSLGGYLGGLEAKRALLALEAAA
ncbi:MAG TPA: methylated-DNA--[protein]-cysteine S-methyltransferase [Terrimesophilobacter sp.]|nr:methylated-DNA--[protein]-cysteine S-methyltransferase [Terrimesophilobacter sp.]